MYPGIIITKIGVVVVKGKYFGRTKDKEKAEKMAEEKIKELMPYSIKVKLD